MKQKFPSTKRKQKKELSLEHNHAEEIKSCKTLNQTNWTDNEMISQNEFQKTAFRFSVLKIDLRNKHQFMFNYQIIFAKKAISNYGLIESMRGASKRSSIPATEHLKL